MSEKAFRDTEFLHAVLKDIYGPREGGAIIVIDAEDARKGVGKTGCAVALARYFAEVFDWELSVDDLLLSGDAYLRRLQEHPGNEQPSVVVWDEAVGAGSGDARRPMAEQNRVLGQAWQTMRSKRIVHLVTLPDWNDLDKRLRKLADYRLYCLAEPIGTFRGYEIETPFDGGGVRTRGLGPHGTTQVRFPDVTDDCPLYAYLDKRKQRLVDASDTFDADEVLADGGEEEDDRDPEEAADEAARREQIKTTLRAVQPWDDDDGMTYRDAAELIDYGPTWVSDRVREWRNGSHRDIVDVPEVTAG